MSKVLVLNTGSSSIRYQLFEMDDRTVLASGLLERIGEDGSRLTQTIGGRPWTTSFQEVPSSREP